MLFHQRQVHTLHSTRAWVKIKMIFLTKFHLAEKERFWSRAMLLRKILARPPSESRQFITIINIVSHHYHSQFWLVVQLCGQRKQTICFERFSNYTRCCWCPIEHPSHLFIYLTHSLPLQTHRNQKPHAAISIYEKLTSSICFNWLQFLPNIILWFTKITWPDVQGANRTTEKSWINGLNQVDLLFVICLQVKL